MRRRNVVTIGFVLILALGFRLVGLDREPFWLDEVFSHKLTNGTFKNLTDSWWVRGNPPLYYVLLWTWRATFGDSESVIRLLSTTWSLIGVAVVTLFAADVTKSTRSGIYAGLIAAVNPLDIYFAQEARNYSQAGALAILSSWLLWRLLRTGPQSATASGGIGLRAAYVASATMLLFTHYVASMVFISQAVFAICRLAIGTRYGELRRYVSAALLPGGLLVLWVAVARSHGGAFSPRTWVGWIPATDFHTTFESFTRYLVWGRAPDAFGRYGALVVSLSVILLTAVALFRGHAAGQRAAPPKSESHEFLAWLVVGPVLFATAVGLVYQPILFPPRFTQLVVPPFLVLVGSAIGQVSRPLLRALFLSVLLIVGGFASYAQYEALDKQGLPVFASLWNSTAQPDYVVMLPAWERLVADYYVGQPIRWLKSRNDLVAVRRPDRPLRVWLCLARSYAPGAIERAFVSELLREGITEAHMQADYLDITAVVLPPRSDHGDRATGVSGSRGEPTATVR